MLVCYLDDSGTDGAAPILTMAGYVGSQPSWIVFERRAKKIFSDFGVTQLHGKDFNDTKHDFIKWNRRKKEAFAARLYLELQKSAYFGVAVSIAKSAFRKARMLGEHPRQSPYGYCFGEILNRIMRSATMKDAAASGATLSFVVEGGNKNDADVLRIFNEEKWSPRHLGVHKVLKSVTFAEKGSSIALQMADFLAFHSRRYAMQCEKAQRYLSPSDLQKVIFDAVPTSISLSHEFLSNDEIKAGLKDPRRWRRAAPWL